MACMLALGPQASLESSGQEAGGVPLPSLCHLGALSTQAAWYGASEPLKSMASSVCQTPFSPGLRQGEPGPEYHPWPLSPHAHLILSPLYPYPLPAPILLQSPGRFLAGFPLICQPGLDRAGSRLHLTAQHMREMDKPPSRQSFTALRLCTSL